MRGSNYSLFLALISLLQSQTKSKVNKRKLRASILIISFFILTTAGFSQTTSSDIVVGAARMDKYLSQLEGKNIGVVVNQTSVINSTHLVDTLLSLGVSVKKIFVPEHGFRGKADAGEVVEDGKDIKTNLPIISLYGKNKKPTAEQFEDLDVLIFDIQDVGVRFYTYISTMHYVMETAAETDKKVMVFDRPNPNGMFVDGPVLDPNFKSFVGMHPIPILYGLTPGEAAMMINGEGWLNDGVKCDLTIIPLKNYDHNTSYNLPIKPSPNLPNDLAIQLYPSLCMFEGTMISVGRGTYDPFQQIGHPSFTNMEYSFKPVSIDGMSKYPKHQDKVCYGIKFDESNAFKGFTLKYVIEFYNLFEDKPNYFKNYFNTLAGTDKLMKQIESGMTEADIKATWQEDLNSYKAIRKNYLLYPDFE